MIEMREFTERDWDVFAGAANRGGITPLIGEALINFWPEELEDGCYEEVDGIVYLSVAVIADSDGVSINGDAECLFLQCSFAMAKLVLASLSSPLSFNHLMDLGFSDPYES